MLKSHIRYMRRILPLLAVNAAVVLAGTMVIVAKPNYAPAAALVMVVLFVGNFLFFRYVQRKNASASSTGVEPRQRRSNRFLGAFTLIWGGALAIQAVRALMSCFSEPQLKWKFAWLAACIIYGFLSYGAWQAFQSLWNRKSE